MAKVVLWVSFAALLLGGATNVGAATDLKRLPAAPVGSSGSFSLGTAGTRGYTLAIRGLLPGTYVISLEDVEGGQTAIGQATVVDPTQSPDSKTSENS